MKIIKNPTSDDIKSIINELANDNLVVYPTDTIYGIASNIHSSDAINKVFDVKNRSHEKPLSVCVHDFKQLELVADINPVQRKIAKSLLPGTYTLLFRKNENVSQLLTSNSDIIGVRIPDNRISYLLTKNFPITTTSANKSNSKTPNNIPDIIKQLGDDISIYIDNGVIKDNTYSTIIDLTGDKAVIVRKGMCDEDKINRILKMNLYYDD